jgi:hypothetical protein
LTLSEFENGEYGGTLTRILVNDAGLLDLESFARLLCPPFFQFALLVVQPTSRIESVLYDPDVNFF